MGRNPFLIKVVFRPITCVGNDWVFTRRNPFLIRAVFRLCV